MESASLLWAGLYNISKPEQKDSSKLLASYGWVGRETVY